MIISQTPLRVSLFGGGTDFKDFYKDHGGAVLSFGIDKYIYIIVKDLFDNEIHLNYSKKESVASVKEVQHDLIREALKICGISSHIEITTLSDIPSQGTGLGSSSTVTVGVLNALHAFENRAVSTKQLIRESCKIEIDVLNRPIGSQDQAIASLGDLQFIEFTNDGKIINRTINLSKVDKDIFISHFLLFYTGRTRDAASVLTEQKNNIGNRIDQLKIMRDIAYEGEQELSNKNFDEIGKLLNRTWDLKKTLSSNISNEEVDKLYDLALSSGALGAKLGGSGSSGFMTIYCPLEKQKQLRESLQGYRELPIQLSRTGSRIIFNI
jgi:D-glycero-alpha-D-manno-heptose-7-phosphate kinase